MTEAVGRGSVLSAIKHYRVAWCVAVGWALLAAWADLFGHSLGFAQSYSGLTGLGNMRIYWLAGLLILAAAMAAAPHAFERLPRDAPDDERHRAGLLGGRLRRSLPEPVALDAHRRGVRCRAHRSICVPWRRSGACSCAMRRPVQRPIAAHMPCALRACAGRSRTCAAIRDGRPGA